jgi:hypothetical protein
MLLRKLSMNDRQARKFGLPSAPSGILTGLPGPRYGISPWVRYVAPVGTPLSVVASATGDVARLGFVEKESILHGYFDAAVFSVNPHFSADLGVVSQRAENESAPTGIAKDNLNVVVSFASIAVRIDAATADHGFRRGAKDPVGKVDQVRTEFGC